MLHNNIQPIIAENLPPEEYRFIKAQKAIYDLFQALEQDEELRSELQIAQSPESFVDIATSQGYEFSASDLQAALGWALEKTEFYSDEFDDYELTEEELEMVAGGAFRAMAKNSYWHATGILIGNSCFHLLNQDLLKRSEIVTDLQNNLNNWVYQGNNTVLASDPSNPNNFTTISGISFDGNVDTSSITSDYTLNNSPFQFVF